MVVQVPLVDFSKTIRLADIPHYYAPDENSGLAAEGLIWFAEEMDRHIWLRAIGAKDEDHLVLQFEQYRLNLRLFTGFVSLPNWPTNMLQIIYIPVNGLGERMLYEKLHRTSKGKHSFHFLRLFQTSELGYHPNEDPAVQVLWDEVASQFNTFPFLGLATTSTYPLLQEWLARIVILSHARRQIHAIEEYVQQARWQTVDRLQRLTTFNRITSEEGLCSLLVARYQTQQRIAEFRDLATHLERLTQVKDTTPVQLDQEAKNCSDDTMRKFYHTPLNVSLGGELSPGLRRLLPQFDRFAQELVGSPIPDLQDMGIELKKLRAEKSEVLALIGAFSSGKTTLLNALLGGNSSKRLFRVNTAANTAIVSEIRAVAAGEYESVHFNFRPQIEHVLASPSPYGFDISLVKNIEALQKLVYSGVLTASQIEIVAPQVREHEPGKTLAILKGPDEITECLTRFLKAALNADTEVVGFPRGTVYFSAKVDQKRLRDTLLGSELAEAIDLRTEVGWDQFQGKKPSVEGDLASFLIERAEVRLHIPLLELTTIADTPGTGSYNDRHDIVTDTYLNRAAGFILLLPTQRT
ncbi:MAG TPA: hypothetical protein VEL31_27555, partial [Ktedonobacteraceae bacterium]|nr:hypothetical protein [Ktedonobacteraceae bacterium]